MFECEPAEIIVLGAGGHAWELNSYIEDLKRKGWKGRLIGCADDALGVDLPKRLHVVGPIDRIPLGSENVRFITALGNNRTRYAVVDRVSEVYGERLKPWILVHPSAYIGLRVEIGGGSCIAPNVVLTAGVTIGAHCIVNVKASISHDCVIGSFCNINPSGTICGNVVIGDGVYLGAGATVKDNVKIGAWSIIGAGAVVLNDIPENVTAVGVPARVVKNVGYRTA